MLLNRSTQRRDLKNLEATLRKSKAVLFRKIIRTLSVVYFWIIFLGFLIIARFQSSETAFLEQLDFLGLLAITISCSFLLVIGLLKVLLGGKSTISDIVTVEGYIKPYVRTLTVGRQPVDTTVYCLDIVSSSKELKTVIINELQYSAIGRIHSQTPDKLFNLEVAILKPKKIEGMSSLKKEGTLLFLPLENYLDSENSLEKIADKQYLAPLQLGRRPEFSATRQDISDTSEDLICEHLLSHTMNNLKFEHFDEKTLEVDTVFEGDKMVDPDNISDVITESGHIYNDFVDLRTRSIPKKDRKGPNFLVYCLIAYAVNYLLIRNTIMWPNLHYIISILVTVALVAGFLKVAFIPIKVALPVRFNRKMKEIYVPTSDGLYKVPWQKSDFSVIARQSKNKIIYDLTLWLEPKFNTTGDSTKTIAVTLYSAENIHGKVYFYWDYINRYMKFDPYFDDLIEDKKEVTEHKNKGAKDGLISQLFSELIGLIFIPFIIILVFSDPNHVRMLCNPFKTKWPKAVHDWSGKVSNWN